MVLRTNLFKAHMAIYFYGGESVGSDWLNCLFIHPKLNCNFFIFSRTLNTEREEMTLDQRNQVNLIQEAKTELDFLALVDDYPGLYAGPILKNAVRRYEVFWLPLAAKQGSAIKLFAPPLDIAWVWHLHMLAPHDYELDCMNIVSQVVDHKPMNRYQRIQGLQNARRLWQDAYPAEPFEVDLNQPTPFFMPYVLKIRYDIEKASYYQSKFYYQVSLPHFVDTKFLAKAVERYKHHLQLKSQHQNKPMVPCLDVDLIWHAHLQHPLMYKQFTTGMFGAVWNPENQEVPSSLGSTVHDSVTDTRTAWSAAGYQFDKPGTAYRGEPPQHRPPRGDGFYASLGRLQYVIHILQVELVNMDVSKTFYVRIYTPTGHLMLELSMISGTRVQLMSQCIINNDKLDKIKVTLHQKALFGEKAIATSETSLLSYLDACPFGTTAPGVPWVIDVPFRGGAVRLATKLSPPTLEGYRFKALPDLYFAKVDHPSLALSFPQAMLSPTDFAKTYLPCESATHTLLDLRGREAFKCRVVHSVAAALSAVEIISLHGIVVASAHTINPNILPERGSIEDDENCLFLNHMEGERAMLIRSRKDWGMCFGKWQRGRMFNRSAGQVEISFFKLNGARGWCEVHKYKGGLYLICLDAGVFVYVDLKRGLFVMSPSAHDVPEIIALAFSVSILYLLCKPYTPTPANESSPSFHKKAKNDEVTPMLLAAGYKSTTVPTNVHLLRRTSGPALDGASIYDLDSEAGPDWIRQLYLKKQEAYLWYFLSGVTYELATKKNESRQSSFFSGFSGGGGGGDGGGDGGGGGGGDGGGGGGGDGGGGGC